MTFHQLDINQMSINPFQRIGNEWMLITAKKGETVNTMTASWGMMGVFWGENVVTVGIRPQRYTKEFVDAGETFSISVLPAGYQKEYNYLGSVSGRDEDKMSHIRLHVEEDLDTPYFTEADTVLICRKLYAQEMSKDCMLNDWVDEKWYPNQDYHTLYIAAIEKVMVKQELV